MSELSMAPRVAANVYVALVAVFLFRLVYLYAQWAFPRIQGPEKSPGARTAHRLFMLGLGGAWIYNAVDELVRFVL